MIPAEPRATLSVSISEGMKVEVPLGLHEVRIGRGRGSDLLLIDPSVSRLHTRIFRVGTQYFLSDKSKNGTFVNGKRVTQLQLETGMAFRIGPYQIHFRQEGGSSLEEPPTVAPGPTPEDKSVPRIPSGCRPAVAAYPSLGFVGESSHIRRILSEIERVGRSDLPVLIEGETGCGKELVSRGIHRVSARQNRPFVVVNCGAISPDLIESELFGHEKGSFTGATAQRKGAFEIAHGGTIFLDEIGELPLPLQPKLLRVLEQKEIKRVGGNETIPVDVRVVAATNRNLRKEIVQNNFRDDLYFRISAVTITVTPLRERREDILILAHHFVLEAAASAEREVPRLSAAAVAFLSSYSWPGNVRELRNAILRAVVMGHGETLESGDFAFLLPPEPLLQFERESGSFSRWEQAEKQNILSELTRQNWNKTRAAKELGIAKSTLFEKLKKYRIRSPESDR
jgi:transcriptional regulator with PAS, ATPase and Fis domain